VATISKAKASKRHISSSHRLTTVSWRRLIHSDSLRRRSQAPLRSANLAFMCPLCVIPAWFRTRVGLPEARDWLAGCYISLGWENLMSCEVWGAFLAGFTA
jgi:hypothetical protein